MINSLPVPMGKHCKKCGMFRSFADYYAAGKGDIRGLHSYCKDCEKQRRRDRTHTRSIEKYGKEEAERRAARIARKRQAMSGHKVCSRCLDEKPYSAFHASLITKDSRSIYCKTCASEMTKNYRRQTPGHRLAVSMNTAKQSARRKKIPFELSPELLIKLWERQNGACVYTGASMTFDGAGGPESVSIDRVDSGRGYTEDNVVLCCTYVNRMKNDMALCEFVAWCQKVVNHQGNR